ncbi:MAG: hypothetical protein ABMA64_35920 [Myxococcota bacterium]
MIPLLLASCGAKYRPGDPVLAGYTRTYNYPVERPHENLMYSGRVGTDSPIIPLLAFGAAYDVDFAVMPKESDFGMLEFARLSLPSGPVWIVLETDAASGDQTLIAQLDGLAAMMPEIPLKRQNGDLVVTDRSTVSSVDVTLTYTSSKGQKVEATLTGDAPVRTAKHRNGQTFNHSQNQLMAALDIPASESLFTADVKIDGKGVKFEKIAGIVPAQFAMEQTQGGLVAATFKIVPGSPASGGAEYGEIVVNTPGVESEVKASPDMLLRMGVAKSAGQVVKCWKDRDTAQPGLKGGRMAFDFTLTGGVASAAKAATLTGDDVFVDEALAKCATDAINTWTFDETITGTVQWPFTFVPGDAEGDIEPEVKLGMGESQLVEAAPAAPAPAEGAPAEGAPAPAAGAGDDLTDEGAEAAPAPAPKDPPISNFTTVHPTADGGSVEMKWLVSRAGDRVTARQVAPERTLTYEYRLRQGSYLELYAIRVEQYGRATPTAAITFNPPIPDLRWAFSGKRASSFVLDVNGQQNLAYGEVEAYWTEGGPKLKVTGAEPSWVKDRPLLTTITYAPDGTADVKVERVGE